MRGACTPCGGGEVSIVAEADEPGLSPSGRVAPGRASSAAVGYPFSVRREYWFDITDTFAVKGGAARYAAQRRPMDAGAKALKP